MLVARWFWERLALVLGLGRVLGVLPLFGAADKIDLAFVEAF